MSDENTLDWITAETMPSAGSNLVVSITQSPTRTTLFPEQTVVASTPEFMELIFLRNEPVALKQTAQVVSTGGTSAEIRVVGTEVHPRLTDIGHVRMVPGPALDLAFTLLKHGVEGGTTTFDDLLKRLTDEFQSPK